MTKPPYSTALESMQSRFSAGQHPITVHLESKEMRGPILEIPLYNVLLVGAASPYKWLHYAAYAVVGAEGEFLKGRPGSTKKFAAEDTITNELSTDQMTLGIHVTYKLGDECLPPFVDQRVSHSQAAASPTPSISPTVTSYTSGSRHSLTSTTASGGRSPTVKSYASSHRSGAKSATSGGQSGRRKKVKSPTPSQASSSRSSQRSLPTVASRRSSSMSISSVGIPLDDDTFTTQLAKISKSHFGPFNGQITQCIHIIPHSFGDEYIASVTLARGGLAGQITDINDCRNGMLFDQPFHLMYDSGQLGILRTPNIAMGKNDVDHEPAPVHLEAGWYPDCDPEGQRLTLQWLKTEPRQPGPLMQHSTFAELGRGVYSVSDVALDFAYGSRVLRLWGTADGQLIAASRYNRRGYVEPTGPFIFPEKEGDADAGPGGGADASHGASGSHGGAEGDGGNGKPALGTGMKLTWVPSQTPGGARDSDGLADTNTGGWWTELVGCLKSFYARWGTKKPQRSIKNRGRPRPVAPFA